MVLYLATVSKITSMKNKLELDKDYYIENGLYVFTAHFHLKRGHCCESGCRHCPYPKEDTQPKVDK